LNKVQIRTKTKGLVEDLSSGRLRPILTGRLTGPESNTGRMSVCEAKQMGLKKVFVVVRALSK
jgi:hypothetical protein